MDQLEQFRATLATYRRHGWQLRRVLMRPATLAQLRAATGTPADAAPQFEGIAVQPADFNAIWLARPSHGGREAWELRRIGEPPYALFELFEPDEVEEDRADVRREMEARLRDEGRGEEEMRDEG